MVMEIDIDIERETPDQADILEAPISQLKYWYEKLDEKTIPMKEFLDAHRIAGVQDRDWMIRATDALAHTCIAMRFIERRLRSEGEHVPYAATDPTVKQVRALADKMADIRKAANRGDLEAVKALVRKER